MKGQLEVLSKQPARIFSCVELSLDPGLIIERFGSPNAGIKLNNTATSIYRLHILRPILENYALGQNRNIRGNSCSNSCLFCQI